MLWPVCQEAAEPADDHRVGVHDHQLPHQQVRLDCVERRREFQEEHPGRGLWLLQVFQNGMGHSQDSILCVSVWSVGKLQRVLKRLGSRKQSFQHNTLHTFEVDRCQGSGTIVIEGRRGGFLGDRDNI